jgi:hypothetical protein
MTATSGGLTGAGSGPGRHALAAGGGSFRSRLAQLLDAVSGTPASPSD